jgi:hypothetical protein
MSVKTKIIGTVTALLLFLSANLFAQHIEMGFAAGFDIADLHYTNPSEAHFLYHISPTAAYNLNGFLSFRITVFGDSQLNQVLSGKAGTNLLKPAIQKIKYDYIIFNYPFYPTSIYPTNCIFQ